MTIRSTALICACLTLAMNTETASACEPSYWDFDTEPFVGCLKAEKVPGGYQIRNSCAEPVELTPEDCDEPCSETLRIEPQGTERLELPDAPEAPSEDVEHVFRYEQADQTGTITIGYSFNPCDDAGACSSASTSGQRTPPASAWVVFLALAALRWRQRRAR